MQCFEFSDSEIELACSELGIPKDSFAEKNSERRKIIDCWSNANIIACPGSGKTTLLLVKLMLLAKRMPFINGKGVCILTHTNVAINEIKERLGNGADALFEHPNYFGTIQGFVNRFLALPFHSRHSTVGRASIIDDFQYAKNLDRELLHYYKDKKSRSYKNVTYLMSRNENLKYGYRLTGKKRGESGLINRLNGDSYVPERPNQKKQREYVDYSEEEKKEIIECLKEVKKNILRKGLVHYDDAYYLAKSFLDQSNVSDLISARFSFLLIDEAQDTQLHQMDIITAAFGASVVKQFYGDPDQAIFSNTFGGESAWDTDQAAFAKLAVSDSKRYGSKISNCLNPFKLQPITIVGNCSVASETPCIILYDDPKEVLPRFAEEIRKRKLLDLPEYRTWKRDSSPFNAIGFVGKENDNVNIHSYYENYSKASDLKRVYFPNLISYFQKRPEKEVAEKGTRIYFDLFISAFIHLLLESGQRHTKASLLSMLSQENDELLRNFRLSSLKWISDIDQGKIGADVVRNNFLNFLKNENIIFKETDFSRDNVVYFVERNKSPGNVFSKDGVDIRVGTIHSVKGETHIATLLLDVENYKEFESSYFFKKDCGKLFCGDQYQRTKSSRLEYRLKTAYVAMSRPTHLLCVALKRQNTDCQTCAGKLKENCKWEVIQSPAEPNNEILS